MLHMAEKFPSRVDSTEVLMAEEMQQHYMMYYAQDSRQISM
jgi:hypothetical protein